MGVTLSPKSMNYR